MAKKSALSTETSEEPRTPTFEDSYRELMELVAQLERGDLPLEQALELHSRGQQLVTLCSKQLEQAELKVRKLGSE
jgi:exodeoxyribonuclease VII small subunit